MQFKVGDWVSVVDENYSGEIISIHNATILLKGEDGFEYDYQAYQLFKKDGESVLFEKKAKREIVVPKTDDISSKRNIKNISFNAKLPEFDLHIEEISCHDFKTNFEALNYQIEYVKEIISKANRAGCRRLVLVHGVGKGVLRDEIRKLLKEQFPNIEYFDASYQKFGFGATELIIH